MEENIRSLYKLSTANKYITYDSYKNLYKCEFAYIINSIPDDSFSNEINTFVSNWYIENPPKIDYNQLNNKYYTSLSINCNGYINTSTICSIDTSILIMNDDMLLFIANMTINMILKFKDEFTEEELTNYRNFLTIINDNKVNHMNLDLHNTYIIGLMLKFKLNLKKLKSYMEYAEEKILLEKLVIKTLKDTPYTRQTETVIKFEDYAIWKPYNTTHIMVYKLIFITCYKKSDKTIFEANKYILLPFLYHTSHPQCKILNDIFKIYNVIIPMLQYEFIYINTMTSITYPYIFNEYFKEATSYYSADLEHILDTQDKEQKKLEQKKKKNKRKKINKKKCKKSIDISNINDNDIIEICDDVESEDEQLDDQLDQLEDEQLDEQLDDQLDDQLDQLEEERLDDQLVINRKINFIISFNKYEFFEDKSYIEWLINSVYQSNTKFYEFVQNWDNIRIIQPLHYDMALKKKSLHFTGKFANSYTNEISPSFHFYIYNNQIYAITMIRDIML